MSPRRSIDLRWPAVALVASASAVPIGWHAADLSPFFDALHQLDLVDVAENVLGYVPLGIVLARAGALRALLLCALLSAAVEVSQAVMAYRSPSVVDLATNILGAGVGLLLNRSGRLNPTIRVTRALAGAATVAGAAIAVVMLLYLDAAPNARGTTAPGRLEASWSFDDVAGRQVPDVSGHGLAGSLEGGARLGPSPRGRALSLDGTGAAAFGHPSALRLTGSMTITAWVRARTFPADDAAIVSSYNGQGYQLDTTPDSGPRTFGFKLTNRCGDPVARFSRTTLKAGVWYHVAGVFDAENATLRVYVNGVADDGIQEGLITHGQKSSREVVQVGKRGRFQSFNFDGDVDEVRIYSFALRGQELLDDMRGLPSARAPATPVLAPDACPVPPDLEDARLPAAAASLGFLAVVAWLGLGGTVRGPVRIFAAATPAVGTSIAAAVLKPPGVSLAFAVAVAVAALATAHGSRPRVGGGCTGGQMRADDPPA